MKPSNRRWGFSGRVVTLAGVALLMMAGCSSEHRVVGPDTSTGAANFAPLASSSELSGESMPGIDFSRVLDAQDGATGQLKSMDRMVLGTAVSSYRGAPALVALTRTKLEKLPATVGGVPVVQYVVGDIRAQSYYCGTSTSRADQCAAGTLGAIVTDGVRNYWLSNWHVFVGGRGIAGDAIDSPGRYDAGCAATPLVGTVSRFSPVRFDGSTNTVDCAIARITVGNVSPIEAGGSRSFLPSSAIVSPAVGMTVKKIGRTTGFTTGTIIMTNATVDVGYAEGRAHFAGCVLTTAMSQPGDSGSLICTTSGNNPVALLFAGSSSVTVGCPIGRVFTAIGAHIAAQ